MLLKHSAANPQERVISDREKPFLIAEFGLNHNRDLDLAMKMADAARESGVDAIKLQSYTTEYFINRRFEDVHALYDIFAQLELDEDFHRKLRDHAVAKGLAFFSTPLTLDWVAKLSKLEVPVFKIASGDVNNWPLLQAVVATKKPMLVSTGAASDAEVRALVKYLEEAKVSEYALLHCVSLYPTPENKANISRLSRLAEILPAGKNRLLGFSDHTEGVHAASAAVIAGAQIIEKHFTLDENLPGPDQKMSFNPSEMKELRMAIDRAHEIRGVAINADCHKEETASDYYGKRSMYDFEGQRLAMRPRHPDFPKP